MTTPGEVPTKQRRVGDVAPAAATPLESVLASIRLVATDMDGTFLLPDHTPPQINIESVLSLESLKNVHGEGVSVVFSTGRCRASALQALGKVPCRDLGMHQRGGAFLNGAVVYGRSGALVHERVLPVDLVQDLLSWQCKLEQDNGWRGHCSWVLHNGDKTLTPDSAQPWARHLERDYGDPLPVHMGTYDMRTYAESNSEAAFPAIHNAHLVFGPEDYDLLRPLVEKIVAGRGTVVRALPTCITVRHTMCSKADGLEALMQQYGVNSQEVCTIGDAENDREMIEMARVGVAMGNASEDLKRIANWIVARNDDGVPGVSEVLRCITRAISRKSAAAIIEAPIAQKPRRFQLLKTLEHPERVSEIVGLVTGCYAESPMFCYMFGEEVRRGLDWMNKRRLAEAGQHSVFWLDTEGHVEGHLIFKPILPDTSTAAEKERKAAANEAETVAAMGMECWRRTGLAQKAFYGSVNCAMQKETVADHEWGIAMFAVRPACQGMGIGTAVLSQLFADQLEPLAAAGGSVRVELKSQMQRNVAFYQRLGFKTVLHSRLVSPDDEGMNIPNWIMVRYFST